MTFSNLNRLKHFTFHESFLRKLLEDFFFHQKELSEKRKTRVSGNRDSTEERGERNSRMVVKGSPRMTTMQQEQKHAEVCECGLKINTETKTKLRGF